MDNKIKSKDPVKQQVEKQLAEKEANKNVTKNRAVAAALGEPHESIWPIEINEAKIEAALAKPGAKKSFTVLNLYSAYRIRNKPGNRIMRNNSRTNVRISYDQLRARPRELLIQHKLVSWFIWPEDGVLLNKYMKEISKQEAMQMDRKDPNINSPQFKGNQ